MLQICSACESCLPTFLYSLNIISKMIIPKCKISGKQSYNFSTCVCTVLPIAKSSCGSKFGYLSNKKHLEPTANYQFN